MSVAAAPATSDSEQTTAMFREAAEAPGAVARQLKENAARMKALARHLRARPPRAIVTAARGSSDNAATFAKYLFETHTGTLTSSAGLSTASVYHARGRRDDTLFLALSQSGRSPDLLEASRVAKSEGAFTLAFVNAVDSPLAEVVDETVPLCAGAEASVAATKTFIATLSALIHLVAAWYDDAALYAALDSLPRGLEHAWTLDWSAAVGELKRASDLYVIARGLGFAAAQEASLKLKETCAIHAEAFSAAELAHGPLAIVREGFPVFAFVQDDETKPGMLETVRKLQDLRARLFLAGLSLDDAVALPTPVAHPIVQPALMIESFYRFANALAVSRGLDPDRPRHLSKVTETV